MGDDDDDEAVAPAAGFLSSDAVPVRTLPLHDTNAVDSLAVDYWAVVGVVESVYHADDDDHSKQQAVHPGRTRGARQAPDKTLPNVRLGRI
jgi:hypothetical protein